MSLSFELWRRNAYCETYSYKSHECKKRIQFAASEFANRPWQINNTIIRFILLVAKDVIRSPCMINAIPDKAISGRRMFFFIYVNKFRVKLIFLCCDSSFLSFRIFAYSSFVSSSIWVCFFQRWNNLCPKCYCTKQSSTLCKLKIRLRPSTNVKRANIHHFFSTISILPDRG